jgi:hypothetical protein
VTKKTKVPPNFKDTRQSFENFERLAKNLMAVPKKDLNKELAKHEKQKTSKSRDRKVS